MYKEHDTGIVRGYVGYRVRDGDTASLKGDNVYILLPPNM